MGVKSEVGWTGQAGVRTGTDMEGNADLHLEGTGTGCRDEDETKVGTWMKHGNRN